MTARRFPPSWSVELTPNCFIVRDASGQALSYIYYESEPGGRSAAKLLAKDEARRIAVISRNCLTCGLLSAVPDAQRRLEYQKASADFTQSCHKSN